MKTQERRQEQRVSLSRRATLLNGVDSFPCLLQDFTSRGFFIDTNQRFFVGQLLELRCHLYPEQELRCKVEVKHVNETSIGTKIVEISADAMKLLQQFLEEYYSLKLNQSI